MIADSSLPTPVPTERLRLPAQTAAWPLAFAVVALAGALLRLVNLGAAPFAPSEAAAAWPALRDALAQPVEGMPAPVSALLSSALFVLFWLVQAATPALARVPVALLSAAAPALAWFWRARLGNAGALLLALLLAVDPWLVTFGRMSESAGLSAALALLTLTAVAVAGQGESRAARLVAALGAGLLLVSGPQGWSWLVLVALGVLLIGPPLGRWESWRLGVAAGAAALLGATVWLARPAGLQAVAASLGVWGAQALPGPYPFWYPWLRLLVDQPLLLLCGLLGVGWVVRDVIAVRRVPGEALRPADRLHRFLLLWVGWGVLLALAPGRVPEALPLLSTGLAFCAAAAWGRVAPGLVAGVGDWREAALVAAVVTAVLLALLFLGASILWQVQWESSNLIAAAALLLLVALLLAGYAWLVSPSGALLVGLGVTGLFLGGATVAALGDLAFRHDARHPSGYFITVALPEADNVTTDLARLSWQRTGNAGEMALVVVNGPTLAPDAQVGWLAREMRNTTWSAAPPAPVSETLEPPDGLQTPARPLVLAPPLDTALSMGSVWNAGYVGADYPLRASWLPSALPQPQGETFQERWQSGIRARLRWLIYREASPPASETVVLWAPPP